MRTRKEEDGTTSERQDDQEKKMREREREREKERERSIARQESPARPCKRQVSCLRVRSAKKDLFAFCFSLDRSIEAEKQRANGDRMLESRINCE